MNFDNYLVPHRETHMDLWSNASQLDIHGFKASLPGWVSRRQGDEILGAAHATGAPALLSSVLAPGAAPRPPLVTFTTAGNDV